MNIKKLGLVWADEKKNEYEIDVLCSKGTYIRSLIDDLGRALGCGAVMTALERTFAYGFTLEDCKTLSQLGDAAQTGTLGDLLIPVDRALAGYEKIIVSPAQAVRFQNGGALDLARLKKRTQPGALLRVYSPSGDFLGLGEVRREELAVKRFYVE